MRHSRVRQLGRQQRNDFDLFVPRRAPTIYDEDDEYIEDEHDDLDDRYDDRDTTQKRLESWWHSANTNSLSALLLLLALLFLLTTVGLAAYGISLSDDVKNEISSSSTALSVDVDSITCDDSLVPQTFLVGTDGNSSTAAVLFSDTLYELRLVDQGFSSPAAPVWVSAHRRFWTVDKMYNRVKVYDSLTRALLDDFATDVLDCAGPFSPSYHPLADQVWMSCMHTNNFLVLDAGTLAHVATVDVPSALASTHNIGPLVLGEQRAVVVFNPDMLAVYDATTTPPTMLNEYTILSTSGFNALWRNAYLDDADLFVFSSSAQTIYKLEWRSWQVLGQAAINAEVVDMTTDSEDRWLYAVVMPQHIETLKTSTLESVADGTAPVTENMVTAVSVNIGDEYVSVGDDRGVVRRFDIVQSSGAPDFAGSVRDTLVSGAFTAVGGIVRANLGCACDNCLKDVSA